MPRIGAIVASVLLCVAAGASQAAYEYKVLLQPYGELGYDGPQDAAACISGGWFETPAEACAEVAKLQPLCDRRSVIHRNVVAKFSTPLSCTVSWEFNYPNSPGTWGSWATSYNVAQRGCGEGQITQPDDPTQCIPLVIINKAQSQAPSPPKACTQAGNPIDIVTATKQELVHTGITLAGIELTLTYDTTLKAPASQSDTATGQTPLQSFGALWTTSFHKKLHLSAGKRSAVLSRGDGTVLNFTAVGAGAFAGDARNPHQLESISTGYRFTDVATGALETFDAAGNIISMALPSGATLAFSYSEGKLVRIESSEGRFIRFSYANGAIQHIFGPDARAITAAYDTLKNLSSLTWQDGKQLGLLYEDTRLPWALTGKIDENGSRLATFVYDNAGRVISTEHADGTQKFSVAYTHPPGRIVSDYYDRLAKVMYRTISWAPPAEVVLTQPN